MGFATSPVLALVGIETRRVLEKAAPPEAVFFTAEEMRFMPHWREGKLAPEEPIAGNDDYVRVVDKLPKVPPSQIGSLTYDAKTQSGGNYWRWTGDGWEPDKTGRTLLMLRRLGSWSRDALEDQRVFVSLLVIHTLLTFGAVTFVAWGLVDFF